MRSKPSTVAMRRCHGTVGALLQPTTRNCPMTDNTAPTNDQAEVLGQVAEIADSLLYLCEHAIEAGPDFKSGAYFVAVRALAEKLQREVEAA